MTRSYSPGVLARLGIWFGLFLFALMASDPRAWLCAMFPIIYLETLSFPMGLTHLLWPLSIFPGVRVMEIAIWILYAIHLILFLVVRKRWLFSLLLWVLIAILVLNVIGCREALAQARIDLDHG